VGHVEKQQNLASILQLQRTAKRLDELSMGTGPPPPANIQQQHDEQLQLRGKVEEIVRVLGEAYPQLENLWTAFHTWMEVPS
ncbi:Ccdc40, partial [Symbiodinium necroappetens]